MVGVWERLVGIVKRALQKSIGRRMLSAELLQTTMCEIESIAIDLHRRSEFPSQVLRPIDFIYKDVRYGSTQLTSVDDDEQDPDYRITPELASQREARTALSETEKMTKKFWTIWKHDYLLELRDRHQLFKKGQKATNRDPKVGDVVLLDEDSQLSREQWPMAIITELVSSKDGKIRSAILRSGSGREIQRPLNRIVPLEIRPSIDEEEQRSETTSNSKRGLVSKVRKALKKKSLDNAETRKQPARAAKKPVDYDASNP
ncbi:hypothetical protein OESDEN_22559, partial [Oesophagostomum dentatum]